MNEQLPSVSDLRRNYDEGRLLESDVADTPLAQFSRWFDQALTADIVEPNAMVVATSDAHGVPSARTVLLKGVDPRGFVFYTNYQSRKGQALAVGGLGMSMLQNNA